MFISPSGMTKTGDRMAERNRSIKDFSRFAIARNRVLFVGRGRARQSPARRIKYRKLPAALANARRLLPLPKGWGEGERDVELTHWASFSRRVRERFAGRGGRAHLSPARRIKYRKLPAALANDR